MSRIIHLALIVLAAVAQTASAANPKDIKRAKNLSGLGECIRCDLSGADMRNGFFQLANMIEANLSGGQFDGANMAGAQLNNGNLSNGSFTYVNFSGARLDGADLRGANLSKAWLNWAWLVGAKLDGADFTGTHLIGAQLQGADLSKVKGLTTLQVRNACGDSNTKLPRGVERPWCPF